MNVELENFHSTELDCNCGCGKKTSQKLALRLQAFIYQLEAHFKTSIKCIVHSGARCKKNHASLKTENDTSYHMGLTRYDEGPGAAVDCHFEMLVPSKKGLPKWVVINKNTIAELAIKSNLFGGIGWKSYPKNWVMIHFDLGGCRTW